MVEIRTYMSNADSLTLLLRYVYIMKRIQNESFSHNYFFIHYWHTV